MLRDTILRHISIEIRHFVSHVREAKPTQKANNGTLAVVRVVDVEGGLSLLLSQGSAEPDKEGFQVLIGAKGTFEVVGVIGGEGVEVEGGAGRGGRIGKRGPLSRRSFGCEDRHGRRISGSHSRG